MREVSIVKILIGNIFESKALIFSKNMPNSVNKATYSLVNLITIRIYWEIL